MQQRVFAKWKKMLNEYKIPTIDEAVDEALLDFIARRKTQDVDDRRLVLTSSSRAYASLL
jgi:trimethylamine:corrinoid methyltransferase-like protein